MWQPLTSKTVLAISIGLVSTVILGSTAHFVKGDRENSLQDLAKVKQQAILTSFTIEDSLGLDNSLDSSRSNFLLASNLIEQNRGQEALEALEGLEAKYPPLAPYVLLKQGRAYQLAGKTQDADKSWQVLFNQYPNSPARVEALYQLGKSNPAYWQEAIAKFPAHPRTQEIIRQLLQKNPHQPQLMAILVKYSPDDPGVDAMRDSLVAEYASQLTPQDWQAIAESYWLKWDYGKAGQAYAKAPPTPRNLYRAGRGYHLGNSKTTAKQFYTQLIQKYPSAEETGLALSRLATIVSDKEALSYLERAIALFPQIAPEALLAKAKILDNLHSPTSANQARQTLLTEYANSETAAEYRWQIASQKAEGGDLVTAWQWAQPITENNPDSPLAPKAGFWIGKWAQKLDRSEDAQSAFKSVLSGFPRSYYAWRSAVALGWDVGDFTTVRHKLPQVVKNKEKIVLPAGSPTFQELYHLGLKEEAWGQFQLEIADKSELTVAEEFTKGLMQLYRGKNLRGINQIWYLKDRNHPEDKQQWHALQQTPQYWQGLYPFPFEDTILKWSQQRQLNPLLVTALIRQESRFEPEIRSWAGALGLMQVMPETGKSAAENIKLTDYSLTNPEDNVNIGTYYLDYTHQKYNNNSMLAVASYNAGPNAVAKWVSRYGLEDADEFVEKIPYKETKGYVESVFENYWNYMLIYNPEIGKLFNSEFGLES
ncbi:MAG: transglycosylase SLT domain-containing protein [Pleurocapsa sp.]